MHVQDVVFHLIFSKINSIEVYIILNYRSNYESIRIAVQVIYENA